MNIITILIWITIAIIAAIAIIVVKLHYRGEELEHEEGSILPSGKSINDILSIGKNNNHAKEINSSKNAPRSLSPNTPKENHRNLFSKSTENLKIRYSLIMIIMLKNFKNQLKKARWIL